MNAPSPLFPLTPADETRCDQPTFANPAIHQARQIAHAKLRPTAAEVEHGMALHQQAVVVDTYGFSAFAASDAQQIQHAMDRQLEPSAIARIDLQARMTRMADDADQRALFIEAWRASGVTCLFRNSGEEGNDAERLLHRLAHNTYVTDQLPTAMKRITSAQDIQDARQRGLFGFCMTTNGVPLPRTWRSIDEALGLVAVFRQLGVRMMHLTYNRRNLIGDGCGEKVDGGLSDLGQQVVREMNRVGVLVDVAHSSEQTALDAARESSQPVVISHATCRSLHEHCRAKSDAVLRAVADTGGLIGICGMPGFLGRSGDINALLDHLDHAIATIGEDHVAIGTDVAVRLPATRPRDKDLPFWPARPAHAESLWPSDQSPGDMNWVTDDMTQSLAWTNWPLFTVGLVQRGYSDQQIVKILGGNMLRVLREIDRRSQAPSPNCPQ